MSKMFENKQLAIHVVSEVVVLVGLVFYFSSQNKKLSNNIADLAQRLEDQEEHINKLEEMLKQTAMVINGMTNQMSGMTGMNRAGSSVSPPLKKRRPQPPTVSTPPKTGRSRQRRLPPKVVEIVDNGEEEEEEQPPQKVIQIPIKGSESDSDLDDEIREEIGDLKKESGR